MTIAQPETCEHLLVKAPFQFRRERMPVPAPGANGYLVRVDVCGVCRSDLHAASSWAVDWQELGHEFGGTVVAAPPIGGRFAAGDRVAVRNASPCGQCPACVAERPRACERLVVNMQGFRDYAVCDERSLVDASGLDDDALSLVEPTNVALDLLHASQIEPAHRVTVMGSGTLGLLTAFVAKHVWGVADPLIVGRAQSSPLTQALGVGTYLSFEQTGRSRGPRDARFRHADRLLVTTPPSTLSEGLPLCRPGAWLVTVGLDDTERCTIALDISRLIFGQHTLKGVCAAPNAHFDQAVSFLRTHGPALRPLIGRRVHRTALEGVFSSWHERSRYEGKTIVLNGKAVQ